MQLTEGLEAVIPVISLVALLYGDAETASGGTRRHQNASSEASSRYSHSIVKTLSGLFQFAAVCSSLSHLHPVSKIVENPWGQIWVTDFGAGQGAFVGHGGSQDYVTNVMQQPLPEQ